jgi:predicted O-methyltransferase YrrM
MNSIVALISIATLVLLLAFAVRLRDWIRNVRQDIYVIRDEVRAIKRSNEEMSTSITGMAAESVNASCINTLGFRFPVFLGGWSIDSFLGRHLIQHLLEHRPKCIVELGSGSSSIIMARTLQILEEKNTAHIAVDHESKYLDLTRLSAQLNGVSEDIEFLLCPLERYESLNKLWYGGLAERLNDRKIDLLVVDGPPGPLQPMSRYPAVPLLLPYMSEHCTVILDDANRDEEQEIARRWTQENPEFNLSLIREGHGLAILTR